MRNLSTRRPGRKHQHAPSLELLWSQVCSAYSQQGNWRAGEDKAFSKALAAFERATAPENLHSDAIVIDFRKRRGRR
jgi:hypothetical protein